MRKGFISVLIFTSLAAAADNKKMLNLSASFTPLSIGAGLVAWGDCSFTGNITVDGSNNISALTERSSNAFSYAQATAAKQPLLVAGVKNGLSVCRFPGNSTNGFLGANLGSNLNAYTACVLYKTTTQAQFDTIYASSTTPSNSMIFEVGAGADKLDIWYSGVSGGKAATGTGSFPSGTWYWACITSDNSTPLATIWKNNVSASTTAQASGFLSAANHTIGKDGGSGFGELRGDIAEWVIANSVLSATVLTNLYNYEVAKWNLP